MEILGLTVEQLLALAGLGVVLLLVLALLRYVLKLTKTLLTVGCLGSLILLAIAFLALRTLGG